MLPADLPPPPPAAAWAERLSDVLLEHLASAARGPRREGLFALWLVTRAAGDAVDAFGTGDRLWRRRHEALAQRLSSLTLPAPLRRALQSALVTLEQPTPAQGALALALLVAPVRDVLGDPIAAAMDVAAREARATFARPA
jgi:hypothetical protein